MRCDLFVATLLACSLAEDLPFIVFFNQPLSPAQREDVLRASLDGPWSFAPHRKRDLMPTSDFDVIFCSEAPLSYAQSIRAIRKFRVDKTLLKNSNSSQPLPPRLYPLSPNNY
jgi:hypothetical protein